MCHQNGFMSHLAQDSPRLCLLFQLTICSALYFSLRSPSLSNKLQGHPKQKELLWPLPLLLTRLCQRTGELRKWLPVPAGVQPQQQNQSEVVWRDVLQETGSCNCGGWLSNTEICRAGKQERTCWNRWLQAETAVHRWNFFIKEASALLSKAFQLTGSSPLRLSRIISLKSTVCVFQLYLQIPSEQYLGWCWTECLGLQPSQADASKDHPLL